MADFPPACLLPILKLDATQNENSHCSALVVSVHSAGTVFFRTRRTRASSLAPNAQRRTKNRFQTKPREKEQMGAISDKLDVAVNIAGALTGARTLILVPATGLHSLPHGGPVAGQAIAQSTSVDAQFTAIANCLKSIAAAVKDLEDRK
jgi:hypothetical protein